MEFNMHTIGAGLLGLSGFLYLIEFLGMPFEFTTPIFGVGLLVFAAVEFSEK